jgi:hypothetical protein
MSGVVDAVEAVLGATVLAAVSGVGAAIVDGAAFEDAVVGAKAEEAAGEIAADGDALGVVAASCAARGYG